MIDSFEPSDLTFAPSAFKHGVKKSTMVEILTYPEISRKDPDRPVIMAVGFDENGAAVEVAYDIARRVVFHAMPIRKLEKRQR